MKLNLPATRVVITDIELPFGSMVTLLVKWALASIPALVILFIIGFGLAMLGMMVFTMIMSGGFPHATVTLPKGG